MTSFFSRFVSSKPGGAASLLLSANLGTIFLQSFNLMFKIVVRMRLQFNDTSIRWIFMMNLVISKRKKDLQQHPVIIPPPCQVPMGRGVL